MQSGKADRRCFDRKGKTSGTRARLYPSCHPKLKYFGKITNTRNHIIHFHLNDEEKIARRSYYSQPVNR